jgi:hypothetical protein
VHVAIGAVYSHLAALLPYTGTVRRLTYCWCCSRYAGRACCRAGLGLKRPGAIREEGSGLWAAGSVEWNMREMVACGGSVYGTVSGAVL